MATTPWGYRVRVRVRVRGKALTSCEELRGESVQACSTPLAAHVLTPAIRSLIIPPAIRSRALARFSVAAGERLGEVSVTSPGNPNPNPNPNRSPNPNPNPNPNPKLNQPPEDAFTDEEDEEATPAPAKDALAGAG